MNTDEFNNQYNEGRRDFSFETLEKIDLAWRQDLIDCNFEGCDLSYGNFSAANFTNSNFKDANLAFSNFSGADLSQVNLQGSNLEGANLSQTKLHGVQFNDSTQFPQGITPEMIQVQTKTSPTIGSKNLEAQNISSPPSLSPPYPSQKIIESQNRDAKKALKEARRIHAEANRLQKEAEKAKKKATQDLKTAQYKAKQVQETTASNPDSSLFSQLKSTAEGMSNFDPGAILNQVQNGVAQTVQQVKQTAQELLDSQSTLPHPFVPPSSSETTSLLPSSPNPPSHELELPPPLPPPISSPLPQPEDSSALITQDNNSPLATVDHVSLKWEEISTFKIKNHTKLVISPDSQLLAVGKTDSSLELWKIKPSSSRLEYMFIGQQKGVYAIAFSQDQRLIASGDGDGKVTIWDISTKKLHQILTLSKYIIDADQHNQKLFQALNPNMFAMSVAIAVSAIAFSPTSDCLTVGYADGTLRNWNIPRAQLLKEMKLHSAPILQIKYSQNGKLMISGSMDQTMKVMIPDSWNVCHSQHYESGWPSDCIITPDHQLAIAGLNNGNIHAWNLATETVQYDMKTSHDVGLLNLHLRSADSTLISVSQDQDLKFWTWKTGVQIGSLSGSYPSCLSPDGTLLATTQSNTGIQLFKNIT